MIRWSGLPGEKGEDEAICRVGCGTRSALRDKAGLAALWCLTSQGEVEWMLAKLSGT